MQRIELTAEVYERGDERGTFVVEAIDMDGEGEVYMTTFTGPDAEERATEYAEAKFADVQRVRELVG